ncbi:hypothetical protein EFN20_10150 [Propionibacterium freudenreichii]
MPSSRRRPLTPTPSGVRASWTRLVGLAALPLVLVAAGCAASPGSGTSPSAGTPSATSASAATTTAGSGTSSAGGSAAVLTSLDQVQVTGGVGQAPTVTAQWPVSVDQTLSKVLVAGSGQVVGADATVQVNYSGTNGRTGQVFDSSFKNGKPATFGLAQVIPGFEKGLTGKHVGDRVLIAVTGKDGYDSAGGAAAAGIQVGDSLFFVVDIVAVS